MRRSMPTARLSHKEDARIVQERFAVNERDYVRTTSDAGRCVVRGGVSRSEACDPA